MKIQTITMISSYFFFNEFSLAVNCSSNDIKQRLNSLKKTETNICE